ncbi:MAG: LamG domain-containing protein [Bacteriovoracaceae bacterium]|nr:LamG domain-containing protein [Bacteriovoracaceae bacterium]
MSKIVNPDMVKPTISYITAAPATMHGAQDFSLEFEVNDNPGGSGIDTVKLMYAPDGLSYKEIGLFAGGHRTIEFCPPNKTHPRPTFKLVAKDKNKNEAELSLGDVTGANFTLLPTEPALPLISSSEGTSTNAPEAKLLIDMCRPTTCSSGALYYETPTSQTYIAVAGAQPSAADPSWLSCEEVLEDGYPLAPFGGDGSFNYSVWVKTEDTDTDGLTPIVNVSDTSTLITITRDGTTPAGNFMTPAGVMDSHRDFTVSFNLSDAISGLGESKIFYSPDPTPIIGYPYVELGTLVGGTPETVNFCVPNKTHPNGTFKIEAVDLAGNAITFTQSGFTINKTADPLLPNVVSMSTAGPLTGGSSRIIINACHQRVCSSGALTYEAADNNVFIAVANAQPLATDPAWVSCSDVLANGYDFIFPPQVGVGVYNSGLWVKSEGMDLDGSTPVATVSTTSVPLPLPYDYSAPALTGLDLGNIGTNRNLEIIGTSILTGYSQGSFRLSPVCLDPASIPVVQSYIAGTVSVNSNNRIVTGTGTHFTQAFQPFDYTEINGIYTQILSIESDTQMTLNEIGGNNPALVGTGLSAAKRMLSYGGIKVTKGESGPISATAPGWQNCDSINQTIVYGNLLNGSNNLQFWIKDRFDNVSSAFLSFTVNYNAPILSVVGGPTISSEIADITINACGGGTKITEVLFNESSIAPLSADSAWQNCSTAVGALKSPQLSAGNHILKAYFKYSDGFISENPVNVPVNYLPQVAWVESPLTLRPQTTYTLASCVGIDEVLLNQGAMPLATDPAWVPCTTTPGGVSYNLTITGNQTVNVWYKTAGTVAADFSQVLVDFVPPLAYIFGGTQVSTTQPPLSIDTCEGVTRLYIKTDDPTGVAPNAGDFASAGGMNCSTALNGIIPPALVGEGPHSYDVWFQFSDGYILDPWFSRVGVVYTAPDITPPPITAGEGATNPLSIFLENGNGDGSVPGVTETIENNASRASFTLNTCLPKPDAALTGTVSVAASGSIVTGSGTLFNTELVAGDFIKIAGQSLKIKSVESDTSLTLVLMHAAGASGVAAARTYPEDEISGMILSNLNTPPAVDDPYWQSCNTSMGTFQTPSLGDGAYTYYAFFKDTAGNVSSTSFQKNFIINVTPDTTPPPRPPVIVEGAPTLTQAPARLTITSCADVDQIYVESSRYPDPYVSPDIGLPEWQNCSEAIGSIAYDVDLAGSYTLSVWFKDAAGNINALPRDISFIFDPVISNLPNPIAYWTMDKTHLNKNRVIDAKGSSHLYRWDLAEVTMVTGRNKEALKLSGTNSYLFTENTSTLRPTISVTLSLWAYLSKNEATTMGLAGNGGYGLKLQGGNLQFYASGEGNVVSVPTSSYESGWRHIVGTSDGRYLKLYLDGKQVGATLDLGSAANLVYGSSQLFVVGGLTDGAGSNPLASGLFTEKLDEVVVWNQYFTDQMVLDHYIDSYNNYKVRQDSTPSAAITNATFYGEFLQNALITLPNCGDAKFIYINETTHPPLVDSPDWQLCNTVKGGIIHKNLSQGPHELKIWTKDEYDNISSGYYKLDTIITDIAYQAPGVMYYTLDDNHTSIASVFDLFSGHNAIAVGADASQSAIQNEGYRFVRASSDFIERKYAYYAQPTEKLTMSIWVNLVQNNNLRQVLAGTRTTNHGYAIEIDQVANELRFVVETSGGPRYAAIPTSAYSSGFHNIIGTYDGRYVKLYIDGGLYVAEDYTNNLAVQYNCLGSFMVGAGASCNTGPVAGTHFNGVLDEVVVWDDALTAQTIYDFFNGQDSVPPDSVPVTPKNNDYTVGVPIARLNVSDCNDIASVYVTLSNVPPLADIANWQACSESGDRVKTPLLETGSNDVKVWFKDMAGNVSLTSTNLNLNFVYDFTIPDPNSYWTLDNVNVDGVAAFDVVSGKDGMITGAVATTGKVDEGRSFNGSDQFIEVPFDASFQPTNQLTLSVWFKVPSFGVAERVLVGNLNDGGYALVLQNNELHFRVQVDGVVETISTPTAAFGDDIWHHAVGIYDNGTLRLFVNGQEILPAVSVAATDKSIDYNNSNSLVMAAGAPVTSGHNNSFFTGELDEVAFWNVALSDTVVAEIYDRGVEEDQVYYKVTPPEIPINLNITYYNSLVSRANLTVSSCTDLDYIIVTKDEFPPDKNDPDWQRCNILVGGLLSKELETSDSFGKLWTKDNYGNISRTFEYVPITTPYDKPISRPVVHWTFDNDHYLAGSRTAFDRLGQINLKSETLLNALNDGSCRYLQGHDPNNSVLLTNQSGVLRESFQFRLEGSEKRPTILRANHPQNGKVKPLDKLSVAAWVYIVGSSSSPDKHIVSNMVNGKGWALRIQAANLDDKGLRFTVNTTAGIVEPYLETKNIATGWHLVVGTFDGQKASLFMDGIFVKSFSLPTPGQITYESGVNTFVGSQASTTSLPTRWETYRDDNMCPAMISVAPGVITDNSYYENKIDEIIIWDNDLSKLEVSSLYHNGADILYETDVAPPPLPLLTLENTRPGMFSNKAYFSLSSCNLASPLGDVISGVLVNEGTMPDKQDERWESCRTRLGSFGLENLTPGGHTITVWFKDLAGNVTPVSADLVVEFIDGLFPSANAVWPLDATHSISKYSRETIDDKVHDLLMVNIDTPLNPNAKAVAGKVNEGIDLAATSATNGAFLSATSTKLLRPVNYFSVGGWFYLTSGDTATKVLIDQHRFVSATQRNGYKLYMSGGQLRLTNELDIAGTVNMSVATSTYTTGWHHVVGIFTGWEMKLYIDGVERGSSGLLMERDFIRYDAITDFRIGAESEVNANPSSYFNGMVDEIALWGFDLSPAQVLTAFTAPDSNSHIYAPLAAPSNVDNAFIYHYDNFGSRARMTILNCTNTPYIFVTAQDAAVPHKADPDWRNCRTEKGAILSTKLPIGTTFVDVYAKNSDGIISQAAGRKEILPVLFDYDLVLPITYFSFNEEHADTVEHDFIINNRGTRAGTPLRVANADGDALNFTLASQSVTSSTSKIFDLRAGLSFALWVDLTKGDSSTKLIVTRSGSAAADDTTLLLENGFLKFKVKTPTVSSYERATVLTEVIYPTSLIETGSHFVVASYDGLDLRLYLDATLVAIQNVGARNWSANTERIINMNGIGGFTVGAGVIGQIDEFMVFDRVLTEGEIIVWLRRYQDALNPTDLTPPALGRNISVFGTTFGANWPTDNSNPYFTIDDCNDINGIYISLSPVAPAFDDPGWQACTTAEAYLRSPTLNPGVNDVYFYYRDAHGNVSNGQQIEVAYNVPVRPDPVAYWDFDDDTLVGMKNYEPVNLLHAHTYGVQGADYVAGGVGKGINFDGARKYVEVEHDARIKPTDELSVSFWVNVPSSYLDRNADTLISNRSVGHEGFEFRWSCTPSNPFDATAAHGGCILNGLGDEEFFEFILNIDGQDVLIDFPQNQLGTGPMHIVGTFDGRFMRLYKNAILLKEKDLEYEGKITYDAVKNTSLIIGAKVGDFQQPIGGYFRGVIDEVAIFDTALYPDHVTDIYTNFIQAGNRLYTPSLVADIPAGTSYTIYEPGKKSFGSRLKITASDCTDTNMLLVNDNAITPPAANDENWQPCNTMAGGILSAPLTDSSTVTPVVWAKTFTGSVSATPRTLGQAFTIPAYVTDIPRPKVLWTLDSDFAGHSVGTAIKESLSWSDGVVDLLMAPTTTVTQLTGTVEISPGTAIVTGTATQFTTDLSVGDRIKIGHETAQIKQINNATELELMVNHLSGAAPLTPSYRIGNVNGSQSAIEGGYDFDGLTNFISIHPNAATNPMYDLTIAAWVELKKGETLHRHIVGNNQYFTTAEGAGSGLRIKNGELQFYVTAWTGSARVTYVAGIDTNIYSTGLHHVTGTYDGQDLKLYLDGVFVKKYAIPFFVADRYEIYHDDFSHWTIGAETDNDNAPATGSFFSGVIDDVQIWHAPLTEQQVYYVYEYGSNFLPDVISDGIAPSDPGIYLADGLTTSNMPWAYFTIPTCTGANGVEINAIYVNLGTDPAPNKDDVGWQFCSLDAAYVMSSILNRGSATINVYFRDEQGDISTPTPFTFTYDPPALIQPLAYYTFDAADRNGLWYFYDKAGTKHIRTKYSLSYSPIASGKRGDSWRRTESLGYGYPLDLTYRADYDAVKNYSASFWYKADEATSIDEVLLDQGQFRIIRTITDTIEVRTFAGNEWIKRSSARLTPLKWNHIAVVRNNNTLKIFLNGWLDSSHLVGTANLNANTGKMIMGKVPGSYDELVMYDSALTDAQVAYLYFKGEKLEEIDVFTPNLVVAPTPDYYWNFDNGQFVDPYLNSLTAVLPLKKVNVVATVQSEAKVGESFFFQRLEDNLNGGESQNTIGRQQYLESESAAPLALGNDFTISSWVKQPVPRGYYGTGTNAPHNDSTAIIDMWGADDINKAFTMTYTRGVGVTSSTAYEFQVRIGNNNYTVKTNNDSFEDGWAHLAVRRKGRILQFYINGIESDSIDMNNLGAVNIPALTRLRLGNSSLYSYYNIAGTVSVSAGSNVVTGTGTQFLTDLFVEKTGTVSVAPGTNAVVGNGTLFSTQYAVGNLIRLAGEYHQIAAITDATNLTLVTNHIVGASDEVMEKRSTNTIRIGLSNFKITSIDSDTQLTLSTSHPSGASNEFLGHNINSNDQTALDEYGYNGYLDEMAIWKSALTQRQIYDLHLKGNAGTAIPIMPVASVAGINGSTIFTSERGRLRLNDCNGFTHVWVGFTADAEPLDGASGDATYPGWVACSDGMEFDTPVLVDDSLNNLRLWFKTGTVVSTYTSDVDVTRATGDTTPPVIPGITMVTVTPTSESFARFTLNSCADIAGVYVGPSGSTPAATAGGWQNCTTTVGAILSPPLVAGLNNISLWFKDANHNISATTDFAVTYNEPAVPQAALYLTMDDEQMTPLSLFQREVINNELAKPVNASNISSGRVGVVNEAINFTTNAYFDMPYSNLTLTNVLSFFSWVNVAAPGIDSHLIGRWDGTPANDSFAIRIDSTGRVCLDLQTTASAGVWNTLAYKRVCSSSKISFASWQHIGVTRNGTNVEFFINNKLAGSAAVNSADFVASSLSVRVGAENRGGAIAAVEGMMDDLTLWTQVLTSDQRGAVYAKGLKDEPLFSESAPISPAIDPDHYWQFDSGSVLLDAIAGFDFVANSGAVLSPGGKIGDYLSFTLSESDVINTNNAAINLTGDFTLSVWVNPTSAATGDILAKWDSTTPEEQSFILHTSAAGIVSFTYQTAPSLVTGSISAQEGIPLNEWSHISVARKGSALYLYVNGKVQNLVDMGVESINNAANVPLSVGGNFFTGANYFNGGVDDLVLYKIYLQERKVRFNYDKGVAGDPLIP